MAKRELKSLFKEAAEVAAGVPEAMQATAFNRALEMLAQEYGVALPSPESSERELPPRREDQPPNSEARDASRGS